MNLDYPPGATPLDPDEAAGLIPSHIANHEVRQCYLAALRAADGKDYGPLLAFVRS